MRTRGRQRSRAARGARLRRARGCRRARAARRRGAAARRSAHRGGPAPNGREHDVLHRLERRAHEHMERSPYRAARACGRCTSLGTSCAARDGSGQQASMRSRTSGKGSGPAAATPYSSPAFRASRFPLYPREERPPNKGSGMSNGGDHDSSDRNSRGACRCARASASMPAPARTLSRPAASAPPSSAAPGAAESRHASRSIRSGRSRCRTTGCSARRSASPSTRAITLDHPPAAIAEHRNRSQRRQRNRRRAPAARPPRRPRARPRRQRGELVGRPRRRLRLAHVESRHHRRSHGQHLDRRQRRRRTRTSLKFSRRGSSCSQLGKPEQNQGSHDPVNFWRVAEISIDAEANEAYVADGYGNKRVVVLDATTGERKRLLGRVRQSRPTTRTSACTIRRRRPPAVPQSGALRGAVARRLRLRLRPRQRSHPGVPQGQRFGRAKLASHRRLAARAPSGTSRSRTGPRASVHFLADG